MSPEVFVEILKRSPYRWLFCWFLPLFLPSLFVGLIVAVFPGCNIYQRTNHEFFASFNRDLAGSQLGRTLVGAEDHGFHFYHG